MIALTSTTLVALAAAVLFSVNAPQVAAQAFAPGNRSVDVAITFAAQRSITVNTETNFWAEGGSFELGANAYKGFGLAADITGSHVASIGSGGIPLSLVTATFGPRYRWHDGHRVSLYGQGLLGEANAFHSFFPASTGAVEDATSLALQVGGGADVALGHHLAVRVLDAAWLRTQLPNSTTEVQNNLRLSAGLVFRIGQR